MQIIKAIRFISYNRMRRGDGLGQILDFSTFLINWDLFLFIKNGFRKGIAWASGSQSPER